MVMGVELENTCVVTTLNVIPAIDQQNYIIALHWYHFFVWQINLMFITCRKVVVTTLSYHKGKQVLQNKILDYINLT